MSRNGQTPAGARAPSGETLTYRKQIGMMNTQNLMLRPLVPEDRDSFVEAVRLFKAENSPFQFTFHFDEASDFGDYIKKLENWSKGIDLPQYFVPTTFLVAVIDDRIIGRISIRHQLNAYLEKIGGHVGSGVIPSCRGRGLGTEMLRQTIPICAALNIHRILITCDEDQLGARRSIEKCGGVLENITDDPRLEKQKRRYWISVEHGGE